MSSKSIKKENRVKWHKRNKFAGVKLLVDTSIVRCLGIYKVIPKSSLFLIEKVIISSLLNNISSKINRLLVKKVRSRLFGQPLFVP